jgi:putative protease
MPAPIIIRTGPAFVRIPELLAPAGTLEKLKTAVHYGADAVYLGGTAFGLRNMAGNFTIAEMAEGVAHAHAHGVKVYLTVNSYPGNDELPRLAEYLREVAPLPFDAYIVADPGVIDLAREISPARPLHLSTQANTINWRSARFWERQGISRINLAREMSLADIRETVGQCTVELEAFVHGALCVAYSGRCLLSSVMAGRSANRGECAHPCRWGYALVEETRPGEYYPVLEDGTGTFIFNSKDLCLLEQLPDLVGAGVASLKIEGRMKGIHYLAATLRIYRAALDALAAEGADYRCRPEWLAELCKTSHRGYTTGFLLGQPEEVGQEYRSRYLRSHDFVGLVEEVTTDGTAVVGVRNQLRTGDTLELLGPAMKTVAFPLQEMHDLDGNSLAVANTNQRIRLRLPAEAAPGDLLRREKPESQQPGTRQFNADQI